MWNRRQHVASLSTRQHTTFSGFRLPSGAVKLSDSLAMNDLFVHEGKILCCRIAQQFQPCWSRCSLIKQLHSGKPHFLWSRSRHDISSIHKLREVKSFLFSRNCHFLPWCRIQFSPPTFCPGLCAPFRKTQLWSITRRTTLRQKALSEKLAKSEISEGKGPWEPAELHFHTEETVSFYNAEVRDRN